jgi:DNA-binding transcriptional MerR regulator
MSEQERWTISELAALADVTPRTIRYYTAEGLLPQPETRGKYAVYSENHLQRLRLIARLKADYLPLHEIRARLEQLTPEQVQELLREYTDRRAAPGGNRAADYISQVLHQIAPQPARLPLGYHAGVSPPSRSELQAPPSDVPAERSTPEALVEPPTRMEAGPGSLLTRLVPGHAHLQRAELEQAGLTPGEHWRRITLAPGVELHVEQSAAPDQAERIAQLVNLAHQLFSEEAL